MTITRAYVSSNREVIVGEAPTATNGVAKGETLPARVSLEAGTLYSTGAGGEVRQEPTGASMNAADLKADGTGILSSAKTPAGSPALSGTLTPKHRVTLPDGIETTLQVAERMGYVERGPDGQYREATPKQEAQPEATDQPQPFADQAERLLDQSVREIPPHMQDGLVHHVLTNKLDEKIIHDTAAASNMSTDELRGRLTALHTAFTAQATAAAAEAGISDFKAWSEWARKSHPAELREAMQAHILGRTTKKYDALFSRYFRETLPSVEALAKAGYKITRAANGRELVEVEGVQMDIKTAAREGLL